MTYTKVGVGLVFLLVFCVGSRLHAELLQIEESHPNGNDSWHWRSSMACGVTSSYTFLRLNDVDVSYEAVSSLIPVTERGSNLNTMAAACTTMGLKSLPVRRKPSDLHRLRFPVIAHVMRSNQGFGSHSPIKTGSFGHYVVLLAVDEQSITFVDPVSGPNPATIPLGLFLNEWSGYLLVPAAAWHERLAVFLRNVFLLILALLVGVEITKMVLSWPKKGIPSPVGLALFILLAVITAGGCKPASDLAPAAESTAVRRGRVGLVAWSTSADLGHLPDEGDSTASFKISNRGNRVRRLELGTPSCKCTSLMIDRTEIPPGGDATLRMSISSELATPGVVSADLVVSSDDWAEVFSVQGVAFGCYFPELQYTLPPGQSAKIAGKLVSKIPLDPNEVSARVTECPDGLLVGKAVVSPMRLHGDAYHLDITIPITRQQNPLESEYVLSEVAFSITASGELTAHSVPVLLVGGGGDEE